MPNPKPPALLTVGTIAAKFGAPVHQVVYLIKSRGIAPVGTAGHARVYDEATVALIGREIQKLRAARNGETPEAHDAGAVGAALALA